MSRSMLPNRFYRNVERQHGERGKSVLDYVLPLVGRVLFVVGIGLVFYGGKIDDKDIHKAQKYYLGGIASLLVGWGLAENEDRILYFLGKSESDLEKELNED